MFRKYEDKRIYRNLKIDRCVSICSCIAILIILINFLILRFGLGFELNQISFMRNIEEDNILELFLFLISASFFRISNTLFLLKRQYPIKLQENSFNNDFTNTLTSIILMFAPLVISATLSLNCLILVSELHMPVYVSNGFLIQNCVLIKREWKTNPPPFVVREQLAAAEKQQEAEEQAQKLKYEQDIETSKKLLKQCGMQFFIDYYPQLKRLPIRDIILSDNYSSEREVRLPPAKKIVESGLTECALRYIIEKFGDVFSSEVIERAKAILHEIENEKTEVNQNENN